MDKETLSKLKRWVLIDFILAMEIELKRLNKIHNEMSNLLKQNT